MPIRALRLMAGLALLALGGLALAWLAAPEASVPADPASVAALRRGDPPRLLPRDGIQALHQPERAPPGELSQVMDPREEVLAVGIQGEAVAYPLRLLSSHEVVNDTVGGRPVLITWCPLCYTGMVFSRQTPAGTLSFGVSGRLLHNNLVLYDHQTDSLWSQLLGEAIEGSLAGTRLKLLSAPQLPYGEWLARHPDGRVVDKRAVARQTGLPLERYRQDPYRSYYASEQPGIQEDNLPRGAAAIKPKRKVVVVRPPGGALAHSLEDLERRGWALARSGPRLVLTLWWSGGPRAFSLGPHGLAEVPAHLSFDFAWQDFAPGLAP